MYWRFVTNLVLLIGLVLLQVAFISALPGWLNNINLVLIILVFILSMKNFQLAVWWVIGAGLILEGYSFLPFGAHIAGLAAAIIIINFLLINVFTNRSLYSYLALTVSAFISYEVVLYVFSYVIFYFTKKSFFLNLNKIFWLDKLEALLVSVIGVLIIFYIFNFISKNFKPVFLIRKPMNKSK